MDSWKILNLMLNKIRNVHIMEHCGMFRSLPMYLLSLCVMQNASLPQTYIQLKAVSIKYYYSMYIHLNCFACKSNALLHIMFDHLWPTWLCLDFDNDLIDGTILGTKIVVHDICILILATTFIWKFSLFKKNSVRCYCKCTSDFKYSVQCFCPVVTKHELSWETSIEIPNTKFHENSSSGSQVISCGQTW